MIIENKFDNNKKDILHYLYYIDFMTSTEIDILSVLVEFQSRVYTKEHQNIMPSRETIAYKAKCSRTSVANFIKKFGGVVFEYTQRKIAGSVKNNSNIYYVHDGCYEAVVMLKYLHLFHNWKKHAKEVLLKMMDDPHFLSRKVFEKHKLSTHKLTLAIYQKLTCINSYLNKSYLDKSTKNEEVPFMNKKEKGKKNAILQGFPLNFSTKQKLILHFSEEALQQTKNDYLWYSKRNQIRLPDKFFMSRAKEYQYAFIRRM